MFEQIEIDPRRCGGSPVSGTRIPVTVIVDELAAEKLGIRSRLVTPN